LKITPGGAAALDAVMRVASETDAFGAATVTGAYEDRPSADLGFSSSTAMVRARSRRRRIPITLPME